MKHLGEVLLGLGVAIMLGALVFIKTTVAVEVPGEWLGSLGMRLPGTMRETHNLGLLQLRELVFEGGGVIAIVGAILTGAGHVAETIVGAGRGALAPVAQELAEDAGPPESAAAKPDGRAAAAILLVVAVLLLIGFVALTSQSGTR